MLRRCHGPYLSSATMDLVAGDHGHGYRSLTTVTAVLVASLFSLSVDDFASRHLKVGLAQLAQRSNR